MKTENIVLLLTGPHGAGKDNIAKKICGERTNMVHISTGEVLRMYANEYDLHRRPDEPLATIGEIQNRGDLVTAATCGDLLVRYVLENNICCSNGLILDGFPRDCKQVDILECRLKQMGLKNPHLYGFHCTLSAHEQEKRLAQRTGRADVTPEALEKRSDIYVSYVIPAIDKLRNKGVPFIDLCVDDDGELWGSEIAGDEILALLDTGKLGSLPAAA